MGYHNMSVEVASQRQWKVRKRFWMLSLVSHVRRVFDSYRLRFPEYERAADLHLLNLRYGPSRLNVVLFPLLPGYDEYLYLTSRK